VSVNFSAFNKRQRQDAMALLSVCEAAGVTDIRFVRQRLYESMAVEARAERAAVVPHRRSERKKGIVRRRGSIVRAMAVCQVCGSPAVIERVNVCGSTMVSGPWRSSISCTNKDCLHVELSEKQIQELTNG